MVISVEYIFIMFFAIIISTIFVYMLTNRVLGIHLRWKPLVLCAICSMVISLVLPHVVVGFAGLAGSMALLAVFAVLFAYFVAKYDTYDEQRLAAAQVDTLAVEDWPLPNAIGVIQKEDAAAAAEFIVITKDDAVQLADRASADVSVPIDTPIGKAKQAIETVDEVLETLEAGQAIAEVKQVVISQNAELAKAADNAENISVPPEAPKENDIATEMMDAQQDITQKEPFEEAVMAGEETMDETLEEIQTLDDLMDYAFVQKEQNNFHQALSAFRKALNLYSDSETAPFIVVELGNILKNKGAYDEAIQVFSDGRNLPALQYDDLLEQEFVTTIAYLRIVKNILLAQRLGFVPYNEIPSAVFEEINAEFCEWRKLA